MQEKYAYNQAPYNQSTAYDVLPKETLNARGEIDDLFMQVEHAVGMLQSEAREFEDIFKQVLHTEPEKSTNSEPPRAITRTAMGERLVTLLINVRDAHKQIKNIRNRVEL